MGDKMNKKIAVVAFIALALTACSEEKKEKEVVVMLDSDVKKFSYAMGMDVGQSLKGLGAEVDSEAFASAVADVLSGSEAKLAK